MNYDEYVPENDENDSWIVNNDTETNEPPIKRRKGIYSSTDYAKLREAAYKEFIHCSTKYVNKIEQMFNSEDFNHKLHLKSVNNIKCFNGTLREYQTIGVAWLNFMFKNNVNYILGDEMGLGKTVQIIAHVAYLYEKEAEGPFVILVPLSTITNWLSEFKRFAPDLPVVKLYGQEDERNKQMDLILRSKFVFNGRKVAPIVVCPSHYPISQKLFFKRLECKYFILDEGHCIKNMGSQLFRAIDALKVPRRGVLTGTPLQNSLSELWTIFHYLIPKMFTIDVKLVLSKYDLNDKTKLLQSDSTNVIQIVHKILARLMLRREKSQVLKELAPKKETIVYCPLSDTQKLLYRLLLKKDRHSLTMTQKESDTNKSRSCRRVSYSTYIDLPENNYPTALEVYSSPKVYKDPSIKDNIYNLKPDCQYKCNINLNSIFMSLRHVINHPYLLWTPLQPTKYEILIDKNVILNSGKFLVLDAMLTKLKSQGGHQILIFTNFVMVLDLVEELCILRKHKYERLDGSRKDGDRAEAIHNFNTNKDVFVFLLTTKAGGVGLNLMAADTVIFIDRSFNPMNDIQAMSRCHRIGQTKPVMIYSLIAQNTVDEYIVDCGNRKKRLESLIISEGKFKDGTFTPSGLKELENLLENEPEVVKISANGTVYTKKELDIILDRSDLDKEQEKLNNNNKNFKLM